MEATTLWEAWQVRGDEAARESLLIRHLPLVRHVARQVLPTLSVEMPAPGGAVPSAWARQVIHAARRLLATAPTASRPNA